MKVDISKIEGYENMTAEEKLKAIESFDFGEPDHEGYIPQAEYEKAKKQFDQTASELAKYKKDLKEKMSEDERRQAEEKEAREKIENELAELKKDKAIAELKANWLSLGLPEESALSSARALAEGDYETLFKTMSAYLTDFTAKVKSDMIGKTPYPQGGGVSPSVMTLKEFKKLSFKDQDKFAREHPEEYRLLYKNGG